MRVGCSVGAVVVGSSAAAALHVTTGRQATKGRAQGVARRVAGTGLAETTEAWRRAKKHSERLGYGGKWMRNEVF